MKERREWSTRENVGELQNVSKNIELNRDVKSFWGFASRHKQRKKSASPQGFVSTFFSSISRKSGGISKTAKECFCHLVSPSLSLTFFFSSTHRLDPFFQFSFSLTIAHARTHSI